MRRLSAVIERLIARGETAYGVNTGFGSLAQRAHTHAATWLDCSETWCSRTPPAPVRC